VLVFTPTGAYISVSSQRAIGAALPSGGARVHVNRIIYIWGLFESYDARSVVMAVLDTAIHVFIAASKSWMAGTGPAMTGERKGSVQ
jgi:hypothetical protein